MEELAVEKSLSLTYVESKGWTHSISGNQIVTDCALCGKAGKFYIALEPRAIAAGARPDYYWDCKVCGRNGSLGTLKRELGDPIQGLQSMQDGVASTHPVEKLPDLYAIHKKLLEDKEAMDYLVCERGYSFDIIEKMQLGLGVNPQTGMRWLVFPYVNAGQYTFAKMRTLPPEKKDFRAAGGHAVPLYHADALHPEAQELILVEGEGDCLSLLSRGYDRAIGVPGANIKKAVWIDRIDVWWEQRAGKERKIYILYDSDKTGQDAAAEIVKRIGIEKCLLIKLPAFTKTDATPGKDITEFFQAGHTTEEFEAIKANARPLEIKGVLGISGALDELESELEERGGSNAPTYDSPWPSLNKILGGGEPGDVIGIIAEGKVGKSTMSLNWLDYFVGVKGHTCLFLCFEMSQKRVAKKWSCSVTDTPDEKFSLETIQRAREIIAGRTADLVLGYCSASDKEKVFDLIRQAVRRYGVKILVVDNLQLMARSVTHSAQETAALAIAIKDLAMELGVLIILVIQPNRVREGEMVAARNAANSSMTEKMVDSLIALHRNRVGVRKADEFDGRIEEEVNFSEYMLCRADLTRYASGGACTLFMDGAKSLVREMTSTETYKRSGPVAGTGPDLPVEQAVDL